MGRPSSTVITKELAESIATKLHAVKNEKKNRPHDLYVVFHKGKRIAHFGIRRSSRKNEGHDFIPRQIYLPSGKAKLLGQCPMSEAEWIEEMKRLGHIATDEAD